MVQLRDNHSQLTDAGIQIVGISYDPVETLAKFSESQEIPYLLLSDPESDTIRDYALHYQDGLPYPGTILIDQQGVIQAKLFREGYKERHGNDELLEAAKRL